MLFTVTTLNFADRATLSIAGADISKAFKLSPMQMGYICSAFAWSYVLAQLPGGWLLDRFGSKTTYFFGLTLWSLFTMFQGTVGFLTGGAAAAVLFVLRLAVGAAEAPSFPGNGRITSAWFPANERGLASAIFNPPMSGEHWPPSGCSGFHCALGRNKTKTWRPAVKIN